MGTRPNETALGRYIGVSKTTVQRWKGGQVPAAKDIKTIHDKLGFSYDWLITGEGEMFDTTARELAAKDEALVAKDQVIEEKDAEIARLTNMIFVDGVGDKHGSGSIVKVADGQE